MNAFFYGNNYAATPETTRIFPFLISQLDEKISFEGCRFKNEKVFESTARISLWKMLRIPYVYTLESSFLGFRSSRLNGEV